MATSPNKSATALAYLPVLVLLGCNGSPARVLPPAIDPENVGALAVSQYDANQDGKLSASELNQCAAIKRVLPLYDIDNDKTVSAEEIANRVRAWQETKIALISLQCRVTMNGQPLSGANVTLTPVDYLAESLKSASGTTDSSGYAILAVPDSELPEDQRGLTGVQVGTYEVSITHPSRPIAAKYNTSTTLGIEVARDNHEILDLAYNVTSR